jgi:hypothetical protein
MALASISPNSTDSLDIAALNIAMEHLKLFIDWRHKMMIRVVVGVSALVVAARQVDQWWLQAIALAIASLVAFDGFRLDTINHGNLKAIYEAGTVAEQRVGMSPGVFSTLKDPNRKPTVTDVLRASYLSAAVLLALGAVLVTSLGPFGIRPL